MKNTLIALLLSAGISVGVANAQESKPKEPVPISGASISGNIEQFLDEWQKTVGPKDIRMENDTIKAIYEIYQTIYNPFGDEKGIYSSALNKNQEYIIPQSDIIYLADENSEPQCVEDFRPKLGFDGIKVLYMTREYAQTFKEFFGSNAEKKYGGSKYFGDLWGVVSDDTTLTKVEFLNKYIPIYHPQPETRLIINYPYDYGEFEIIPEYNIWELSTRPNIPYMIFDGLKHAKVCIEKENKREYLYMKKQHDKWIKTKER